MGAGEEKKEEKKKKDKKAVLRILLNPLIVIESTNFDLSLSKSNRNWTFKPWLV